MRFNDRTTLLAILATLIAGYAYIASCTHEDSLIQSNGGHRSLWAARGKAPIWLMIMAYSIIAGVWGVIFSLIFRIVKINKLGKKGTQLREAV